MRPEQTMIGQGVHVWKGASGKRYRYHLYMFGTAFGPGAANFIFAREIKFGLHFAVFVGQTADISLALADEIQMQCIRTGRPTHIHVRYNEEGEEARVAEQKDLIEILSPPCNHRRGAESP